MNGNLGKTDRIVRGILGVVMVGYGLRRGKLLGVLGLYPLATAIAGTCPLYAAMGISTKEPEEEVEEMMEVFEEPVEVSAP